MSTLSLRRLLSPVVAVLAAFVAGGCKDQVTAPPLVPTAVAVAAGGATCSPPPCNILFSAFGQTIQFTAAVLDQNGDTIIGQTISWSSSNTDVATVSPTGLVTAVANGSTQITAHSGTLKSVPTPVGVAQEVTLLQKVAGDDQTGTAGGPLPVAISVQALDASGSPIAGATVRFVVTQGGGSVSAPTVVTSANGQAAVTWTLGTTPGAAQQVTVSAARMQFAIHPTPPGYPDPTPQTFTATAN